MLALVVQAGGQLLPPSAAAFELPNPSTPGAGSPLSRHRFQEKFPLLFPVLRLLSKFVHLVG